MELIVSFTGNNFLSKYALFIKKIKIRQGQFLDVSKFDLRAIEKQSINYSAEELLSFWDNVSSSTVRVQDIDYKVLELEEGIYLEEL